MPLQPIDFDSMSELELRALKCGIGSERMRDEITIKMARELRDQQLAIQVVLDRMQRARVQGYQRTAAMTPGAISARILPPPADASGDVKKIGA